MLIAWDVHAWEDYLHWLKHDRKIAERVNQLVKDACRTPFQGLGKPKPLGSSLAGYWSRRITQEHRLVYSYDEGRDMLVIVQCRYHY